MVQEERQNWGRMTGGSCVITHDRPAEVWHFLIVALELLILILVQS